MDTRERVLRFVETFRRERQFGPTTREIADGVGLKSNSTAAMHLDTLRRDGLITWASHGDGTMVTRSVWLTPAGRELVKQPPPPPMCPECGSEKYRSLHSPRGRWRRCDDCGYLEELQAKEIE